MIKYNIFIERFELIEINFNFKFNPKLLPLLYEKIKHLSQEQCDKSFNKILAIPSEAWREKYNFGKIPNIQDFINYFTDKQEFGPEQQAKIEVERILRVAKGYISGKVMFDSLITNAVARDYGIGYINNHLTNTYLDFAKSETTIRKELIEKWLVYFYDKVESAKLIKIDDSESLEFIGNEEKCKEILNRIEPENKQQNRIDCVTKKLIKSF